MAQLNESHGTIVARCPGCNGGTSTFEWKYNGRELGSIPEKVPHTGTSVNYSFRSYRLFRCAGCGRGGLGSIRFGGSLNYPGEFSFLEWFYPEAKERMHLPPDTPDGLSSEFREAEVCLENRCFRAAAGLFRSVLEKTLHANGYKPKREKLVEQIDAAAADGAISEARRKRAHEDIRVLGNDVLHDEWEQIELDQVELAHHYSQRILEDFYDDRETVLKLLRQKGRVPDEDKATAESLDRK